MGGIGLRRTVLFAALSVPLGELFVRGLATRVPGAPAGRAAQLGAARRRGRSRRRAGARLGGVRRVAEALRAHLATEHGPLTGAALTLVHLTCAALWTGGLPYALRTLGAWRGDPPGAALLGRYAGVALVLLAAITATGVCSSLRRAHGAAPADPLDVMTDWIDC